MNDTPDPDHTGPQADRAPRASVMLSATIEQFGASAPTTHRVRDLSAHGARVDRAEGLKKGATVLVSVGALKAVGATVMWVADGAAGLKFVEAIDTAAARARAFISPAASSSRHAQGPKSSSAGWLSDIRNPYRKP